MNRRALLALVLQVAFLATAFGWRTMVHRRRTGDSGFRWQRHRVARVSGALFASAIAYAQRVGRFVPRLARSGR